MNEMTLGGTGCIGRKRKGWIPDTVRDQSISIHSSTQQVFIEYTPCARHCVRFWVFGGDHHG